MNISLIELNTRGKVNFDVSPNLDVYINEEVRGFENIKVVGSIIDNGTTDYEVSFKITGYLILRSAINNNDVKHEIDIKVDDFVENFVEIYKINANTLDILPIIWENILLEIPIRAVNSHDSFERESGDGWEIISEED